MPELQPIGHPALETAGVDMEKARPDAKLRKAAQQFEAYFVGTLLKKMHESAAKGGLFNQRTEAATFREMFDDAIAAEIGRSGAFGIADMLCREMSLRPGPGGILAQPEGLSTDSPPTATEDNPK